MAYVKIDLVNKIKRGDQKAKDEFILNRMPLLEKLCDKVDCETLGIEREDLLSVAMLGLLKAIDRFDEVHSMKMMKFAQFTYGIIRSDIVKFIRKNRMDNKIWLDEKIYNEKTDEWLSNLDLIMPSEENVEEEATDNILEEEIRNSNLTEKCSKAVSIVLSKESRGLAQREIAEKLGTSQPVFAQNLKRSIPDIKENLFSQKELEEFGL